MLSFFQSLNGEELARELIGTLSVMLGIRSNMLLSALLDRANVTTAAMGIVSVVYPATLNIGCMSQALDSSGDKLNAL